MRIGYTPYSLKLDHPADNRRFVFYAKERNLNFEIADPNQDYDLVIVTEAADLSVWSEYKKGKVIFDLIDPYLSEQNSIKLFLRGAFKYLVGSHAHLKFNYKNLVKNMCINSFAVVCTSIEQKIKIKKYCKNVHLILDDHTDIVNCKKKSYECSDPFNLVWEGQPGGVDNLIRLKNIILNISKSTPVTLNIITDPVMPKYFGKIGKENTNTFLKKNFNNVNFIEWNRNNFCAEAIKCDLAIIPINLDNNFDAGKPENKLLLFWKMGLPTIVSPTPSYVYAMKNAGVDGVVYDNNWESKILEYINNKKLRTYNGEFGFKYVSSKYKKKRYVDLWDTLFNEIS